MSQPTPYSPKADYSVSYPGNQGNDLDKDFDALKLTTDDIRNNLALIQRDDTQLKNNIVHPDSLTAATKLLISSNKWTVRGLWSTGVAYAVGDLVEQSGNSYLAAAVHVSGTFDVDHTAGKWVFISNYNPLLYASAGGTADALTASMPVTALVDGTVFFVVAASANATATPTLNISSLGAKTIVKNGNQALVAGDIAGSGHVLQLVYRLGITSFELLNPGWTAYIRTLLATATAAAARAILSVPSNAESILQTIADAKGDLIVATGADVVAKKPVGANGTLIMARSADTSGLAYVAALNSTMYGFTFQNNAIDAVNDLDIAAGGAIDATGAYFMVGAALTKQSDFNWVVGTGNGMLDTGAVGNNDYYLWVIARSDTGVVDYLSSLSSTAPTMPTSYDFKRLIGWFKRVGGTVVAFHTYEGPGGSLDLAWDAPTLDVNLAATLTTARRTDAMKVPLNFAVTAHLNIAILDAVAGSAAIFYCPDQADLTPDNTAANLTSLTTQVTAQYQSGTFRIRTSALGLVAARSSVATMDNYRVSTLGFNWARR